VKSVFGLIIVVTGTALSLPWEPRRQAQVANVSTDQAVAGRLQHSMLAMGIRNDGSQQTVVINGIIAIDGDKPCLSRSLSKPQNAMISGLLTTSEGVRTTITDYYIKWPS